MSPASRIYVRIRGVVKRLVWFWWCRVRWCQQHTIPACLPACRNGSVDDEGARKLPVALKFRKVSEETNKQCAQAGSVTTTFDLMSVSLVGLVLGNSSGISALRTCVYV
jgi:hypothetical protein